MITKKFASVAASFFSVASLLMSQNASDSAKMAPAPKSADSKYYELRIYHAMPGKMDDLNARFRDHTMSLFEKHGISSIGYWIPIQESGTFDTNTLVYIISYASADTQAKSWNDFMADADWKAAAKESEKNGRLVKTQEHYFLNATDYSPEIKPSKAEPRVFELRIYTAQPGKLSNLDARFRDHTVALFKKHGMTSFGYWHLASGPKAESMLYYILAHKSQEAGKASFDTFRADPNWVAAKKESEEKGGGSLTILPDTDGVRSIYMKPTDYSPTK